MEKDNKRIYLSSDEAISVLPEKEDIHTFINGNFGLVGAGINRKELENRIKKADFIELCGDTARSMNHGIVIYSKNAKYQSDLLFIETDEEKLKSLEKACGINE